MTRKLDPEDRVLDKLFNNKEDGILKQIQDSIETLGWEDTDDILVEIGGSVVSGIDQPEGYNKKWATPFGVRKYNKDAFIVISNQSRRDLTKSQPPEYKELSQENNKRLDDELNYDTNSK